MISSPSPPRENPCVEKTNSQEASIRGNGNRGHGRRETDRGHNCADVVRWAGGKRADFVVTIGREVQRDDFIAPGLEGGATIEGTAGTLRIKAPDRTRLAGRFAQRAYVLGTNGGQSWNSASNRGRYDNAHAPSERTIDPILSHSPLETHIQLHAARAIPRGKW